MLVRLGYAGSLGSSLHLGGTGDEGADGMIASDHFGFERVYVQAKRYTDKAVDADTIRSFVGTLEMKGATRGVFITTSTFTAGARATTKQLGLKKVELVDGPRLAQLMVEHSVGVREIGKPLAIKTVDASYFEDQ